MKTGVVPEAAGFPYLVVVEGEGAGRAFALSKATTTIGRDPAGDIVVPHATVSWHHAAVTTGPEGIVAEDLGSRNGTFVGIDRIARRALAEGDVIGVGDRVVLKLTYLLAPAGASADQARARAETPVRGLIPQVATAAALAERLRTVRASAGEAGVSLVLMFVRIDGAFARPEVPGPALEVLMRRIAGVCRATMTGDDLLARASDREFILLLHAPLARAARTAEKIRALAAKQLKRAGAAGGAVIATAALVPLPTRSALGAEALLLAASQRAGHALAGAPSRIATLDLDGDLH